MSKTPFMPLWVSDFLGDTLDLDAAEIGAYMLLLMAQWNRDGNSLPDDPKKLQRVARCGRNWTKVWSSINRYFDADENGVFSRRLRLEAQNVASKREVNARNGALGGKAKSLNSIDVGVANATEALERNPSIPEPEPYKKEEAKASLSPSVPKKASPTGSRIPNDWTLSKHLGEWSIEQGATEPMVRSEADKFRDYWISVAGAKGRKADWDATWRNWIRKAISDNPQPQFKAINGGRYDQARHDSTEQRGDPALEHIARLAGVGQTSGDGRL